MFMCEYDDTRCDKLNEHIIQTKIPNEEGDN